MDLNEIWRVILLYLPISVIGFWRWSFWLVRRLGASLYRPVTTPWPSDQSKPRVSIVTPVYNEDPDVFEQAMQSWIKNGVYEIIAVIDYSNEDHIANYEANYVKNAKLKTKCRLIVTTKPGKRAALADGILETKGELIALVDSDTIWSDDVVAKSLPYFVDERVGGATLEQRISNPHNLANVLFDILLWTRYRDEVPFLLGVGKAFNTLSGRTAIYRREAILNDKHDNLDLLVNESFLGTRSISGDDKRLTHLILQQGWHTMFVVGPVVYTPGLNSLKTFFKQRLRWTRNSWRADLRAVGKGWVFKHPALALFMVDRFIQPLLMLLGPIALFVAVTHQDWIVVAILIGWWFFSRLVKLFGYFKAHPKRLIYLPGYIVYGYVNAILKIYAFATLIEHSWATRWHKDRAARRSLMRTGLTLLSGIVAVLLVVWGLNQFIQNVNQEAGAAVPTQPAVVVESFRQEVTGVTQKQLMPPGAEIAVSPEDIKIYTVVPGDTMYGITRQLGVSQAFLKKVNGISDPDKISPGQQLMYYINAESGASDE